MTTLKRIPLVVYISICVVGYETKELIKEVGLSSPLTNFVPYEGHLYIGGANTIYLLNENLDIIQTASTCNISQSDCSNVQNVNKILLIHQDGLIVCGTGNNGTCELRNASDIGVVLTGSSREYQSLIVSSDVSRPATGIITKSGHFTIAVTFGDGIQQRRFNSDFITYHYAISTRDWHFFQVDRNTKGTSALLLEIFEPTLENYVIYYKACFQHNDMTYFVTNQKQYVGSDNYISKLVRICQDDIEYGSYTDIVLQCTHNGETYNLLQSAILVDVSNSSDYNVSSPIVVAAFTRGTDPESPSGDSAVCITDLKSLDDAIMAAKKENALSCVVPDLTKRYIPSYKRSWMCLQNEEYLEEYVLCSSAIDISKNVIGETPYSMDSKFMVSQGDGVITTLHGTVYTENKPVIMIGTADGNVVQTNLLNNFTLEEYKRQNVGGFHPIRKLHSQDDDTLFVMSSHSVMKFSSTNCSEFFSCAETMDERHPLCGWCVYRQRSTRQNACSSSMNHWLSSLRDCVLMSVEPLGIPVTVFKSPTNLTITITVKNLPAMQNGDVYSCRWFGQGSHLIDTTAADPINLNLFSCKIPIVLDHTNAIVELLVKMQSGATAVLTSTPFLYFECGHYRRCGECVSSKSATCHWCSKTAVCQAPNSCSLNTTISEMAACPHLLDMKGSYYIPDGIKTTINIKTANFIIDPTLVYKCVIPEVPYEVKADAIATDSISCPLYILKNVNGKKDYIVVISYGPQSGMLVEINDAFQNFVTVYSCAELASDCSHCRALNKTRYSCDWCEHRRCVYGINCALPCPSPSVTKVTPRNGPIQGGTKLTIFGTNLGINVSDIEDVTIANISCSLSNNSNDYQIQDDPDFDMSPPSRIVCATGEVRDETTTRVDVTVKGQTSATNVTFSYKKSTVAEINPTFGPQAGGTRITLYGDNLGIGNRQIRVILGSQLCIEASVYPNISLNSWLEVNFTVECTTQWSPTVKNATILALAIDGTVVVYSMYVLYSFVTNPVVKTVSPQKGFVSGGTKITVDGNHMGNALSSFLQIGHGGEVQERSCTIMSPDQTVCTAPIAPAVLTEEIMKDITTEQITTCAGCIEIKAVLGFDGVRHDFTMTYFRDPVIHRFPGDDSVVTLATKSLQLVVKGEYLNLVATIADVSVTVGTELCAIINMTSVSIVCIAPATKPQSLIPDEDNPAVTVNIGNIHKTIGYVRYTEDVRNTEGDNTVVMVVSVVSAVAFVALVLLGIFLICRMYRKMTNRIRYLERSKEENELTAVATESRYTTPAMLTDNRENTTIYDDISDQDVTDAYNEIAEENEYEKSSGYLEPRPYLQLGEASSPEGEEISRAGALSKESTLQSPCLDKDYIHPLCDSKAS